jgi:alpha-tubulin suppressor-like RCC1 family protein
MLVASSGTAGCLKQKNCTVRHTADATVISCPDGTAAVIGLTTEGTPPTSCSVVQDSDGSVTIACPDGSKAVVPSGEGGEEPAACTVVENADGSLTIACPDGSTASVPGPESGDDADDEGDGGDGAEGHLPDGPDWSGGEVTSVAVGNTHTCARNVSGAVKCWGANTSGKLGYGDTQYRGDDAGEMGAHLPIVDLGTGRGALAMELAGEHTCVLLTTQDVACWGDGYRGRLGSGDDRDLGDVAGDMGGSLPIVDLGLGRTATGVTAGENHTCALLDGDTVKCWGWNDFGQLGYGDREDRGDELDEMGDSLLAVDLGTGRSATAIAAGAEHTCAVLDDATLRCWGRNSHGQLGYGDVEDRGDELGEMGDSLLPVDLGEGRTATALAAGKDHTCALLDNAAVKCWGGRLTARIGDEPDEMGNHLAVVDLGTGSAATAIAAGRHHTCALVEDVGLKCWGRNNAGQLGYGDTDGRGDGADEVGDARPVIELGEGRTATAVAAGGEHTCALLDDSSLKCWGANTSGQLGHGDTFDRGDDPEEMGDALPAVDLGTEQQHRADTDS